MIASLELISRLRAQPHIFATLRDWEFAGSTLRLYFDDVEFVPEIIGIAIDMGLGVSNNDDVYSLIISE